MSFYRFFGYWLAIDAFLLGFWCLSVIAKTARQARDQRERDLSERSASLDGFIANPVVNSIHDGSAY